ncbi:MAG: 16S rRNA (guanine(966)-N(2))-methyltransferase RsmD [Bryobacterales bacterium]|nr:16S rRNA (guanine(966)-N(2))-methyltransferase RsmD [Bryobacterales bacterium]
MRVIAGEFRRRLLKSLEGMETRPTPDRLREALFNVLQGRIEGVMFVDAYAGTGAVGIEALSRGAALVVFIERSKAAVQVIQENLAALKVTERARVIRGSVGTYVAAQKGELVFLDPPYAQEDEYEKAFAALQKTPPALVIAQHASRQELAESYGPLRRVRVLRQGDNSLSFYEPVSEEAQLEDGLE